MADELLELRHEAEEASESLWFIGAVEEIEHTDITLSMRLHIRPRLFVQVFLGTKSDSLYLALIDSERRLFGIDRESGSGTFIRMTPWKDTNRCRRGWGSSRSSGFWPELKTSCSAMTCFDTGMTK
jgi:hypothetical protein